MSEKLDVEAAPATILLGRRAAASARLMVVRGLLIRGVSAAAAVALLSFVSPAEYGILAVVRGISGLVEQGVELGLAWPLLRQTEAPSRRDYAALGTAQFLLVAAVFAMAALWPAAGTAFGALSGEWRVWLLGVLGAMVVVPFGTGARIRLERELNYRRIAFVEVSAALLHVTVVLTFLFMGRFPTGVFVAQIAVTLYTNALLYAASPGPGPTWRIGEAFRRVSASGGYSGAYVIMVAREQAPTLIVASLFGLREAGVWAFAIRLAHFLQFAHEGYTRVGVPAAARLAHDPQALRRLSTDSLTGAALISVPLAVVLAACLPMIRLIWPHWNDAVGLAQVYVPCAAIVGSAMAGLGPVAFARRGWRAVVVEHGAPLAVLIAGMLLLRWSGLGSLEQVVIVFSLAALASLFAITDAEVRPAWTMDLTRLVLALASGLAVYLAGTQMHWGPIPVAAAASAAIVIWLSPRRLLQHWRPELPSSPTAP